MNHQRLNSAGSSGFGGGGMAAAGFYYDLEMQVEEEEQAGESCYKTAARVAGKFVIVNLVLIGAGGFVIGGSAGAMTTVGLSWLSHNTIYPINYQVALGFGKLGASIGIAVKTINGIYRSHHAGLCNRRVSICSYLSRLCGG